MAAYPAMEQEYKLDVESLEIEMVNNQFPIILNEQRMIQTTTPVQVTTTTRVTQTQLKTFFL